MVHPPYQATHLGLRLWSLYLLPALLFLDYWLWRLSSGLLSYKGKGWSSTKAKRNLKLIGLWLSASALIA